MRTTRTLELTVGLFVALGLAAFFMLAMRVSNLTSLGNDGGYTITAAFDNIGGLKVRSPVTLAGVTIGRVASISIDQQIYEAVVKMAIDPSYDRIPVDTSASIYTAGLVGEQYIGLEPGGMDDYLGDGDSLELTQSALVIEQLVGRLLTGAMGGDDEASSPSPQ